MPYIKEERRAQAAVYPETPGELNFAITKLVVGYLEHKGKSYATINDAVGVLECAKLELYRRVAAPYEDTKCFEHGEVYGEMVPDFPVSCVGVQHLPFYHGLHDEIRCLRLGCGCAADFKGGKLIWRRL